MSLRARVDRHRCIGAGNCITIAPTAFDWYEGDFAKAGVVDAASVEEELLREAALACPTGAIMVEEVEELLPWQLRGREAPRRVEKTFMFTDIEGSTNLVEALGDEAWQGVLRWHDETLRSLFAEHKGEEVVATGDGFFVGFDSPGRRPSRAPSRSSAGSPSTGARPASRRRCGSACTRRAPRRWARTSPARACTRPPGSRRSPTAIRSCRAERRPSTAGSRSRSPGPSRCEGPRSPWRS